MGTISELGYLGVGVSDVKAWHDIATSIFGMQVVPGDNKATSYLRLDAFHHRLELHANGGDDLEFAGWEVPDAETLDAVAGQLEKAGVKVAVGSRDEADQRRVIGLIRCVDPAGIPTEIFFGRPVNPVPFYPSRATSGFKTEGEGLGHIVIQVPDLDASVRFYRDLLGFRISDFTDVQTPGGMLRLAFLHCNTRHHSIAFAQVPGSSKRLNHIMFEGNSLNDVGTGRDLCLARGVPVVVDLGVHMNDRIVSFYMGSPSGFALEYGWGARTINEATWQTEHYSSIDSIWGHPQLRSLMNDGRR